MRLGVYLGGGARLRFQSRRARREFGERCVERHGAALPVAIVRAFLFEAGPSAFRVAIEIGAGKIAHAQERREQTIDGLQPLIQIFELRLEPHAFVARRIECARGGLAFAAPGLDGVAPGVMALAQTVDFLAQLARGVECCANGRALGRGRGARLVERGRRRLDRGRRRVAFASRPEREMARVILSRSVEGRGGGVPLV